ncbi:MAG: protein-L-isoaspartate(D-aspartate) O-methyltransferase [Myxococcota bacterium]
MALVPSRASEPWTERRDQMVHEQLVGRDIRDPRVLAAMREVPRHEFVPESERARAYDDHPLPIGYRQTISQPYIVAAMTERLELTGDQRVLEIGTGSGYQTAVLARLAKEVYSIEIIEELAERASADLSRLGYHNVTLRSGDGYRGWSEHAPFDAIIVTAAPDHVPQPLIDQLAMGGRMVVPVGKWSQELVLLRRTPDGVERKHFMNVRFVPMTGQAQE